MWSDLPAEAREDPFRPPAEPCRVRCLHCGQEYSSSEIVWRRSGDRGFWRCPVEDCGGAGFGFDIFPVDEFGFEDECDDECDEECEGE